MRSSEINGDIARQIRLVVLDVDGVLTDNGVYIGEGIELKRFNIQDGLGIRMLGFGGITVAFVSGRLSPATTARARELGIDCYQGQGGHKAEAVKELMEKHRVDWDEIAWVGDDLPDLPAMIQCGLPVAVANSTAEILAIAAWTTSTRGGEGAVREFVEAFFKARGEWEALVERYVSERS